MSEPFDGATVVVTHHAPHVGSLHARNGNDIIAAAYVSDLATLIEAGKPRFWIHGHVHSSFDYTAGRTRVVCNAHGYGRENAAFDPALVVEIGS